MQDVAVHASIPAVGRQRHEVSVSLKLSRDTGRPSSKKRHISLFISAAELNNKIKIASNDASWILRKPWKL